VKNPVMESMSVGHFGQLKQGTNVPRDLGQWHGPNFLQLLKACAISMPSPTVEAKLSHFSRQLESVDAHKATHGFCCKFKLNCAVTAVR
jgi:hypothetical protein